MHMQRAATALILMFLTAAASAAVSVTSGSFTYSQNFNTLASASGASQSTVAWTNDSTLSGWSLFTSTLAAPATYRAEIGNQDIGSFTSYGAGGSAERALGAIGAGNTYFGSPAAGAVAGYIAVAFTNNSGGALDSFTLGFSGEEWRQSAAGPQTMVLQYGLGASFSSVASWTAPGGLFDWTSPRSGNITVGGIDGNGTGKVTGRGGSQAIAWAPGETLWIRWIERNEAGPNHGMGIDDLSFSVTAAPVPEPSSAALLLLGAAAVFWTVRARAR